MNKKGQVAMEYILIVGFAFFTSILLFILFYEESNSMSSQITSKQIDQIASKIANNVDKVYYLGEHSKTTLKVTIPSNIVNTSVSNKEIIFRVRASGGISENVKTTVANVTGQIPSNQGLYYITIESQGDHVLINYT